jgi:CheY-like chemotaxis protein
LVVDDHDISRRYTVAALRQTGATVKEAGTPEAALKIALRWLPDAICADLQLPGMSGYDLIRRIRQGWPGSRPRPLVIVLSADPVSLSTESPPGPLPEQLPGPTAEPLVDRILLKPATPTQLRAALLARAAQGVMEAGAGPAAPQELQRMFRQELSLRLPGLESSLVRREFGLVRAVLHQLLASSRLCGDRRLEADLQALHTACHDGADAAEIACRYYALLVDAGHWLGLVWTEPARRGPAGPEPSEHGPDAPRSR